MEWGSRLQSVSPGVGFWLVVAINCKLWHSQQDFSLSTGPTSSRTLDKTPLPPKGGAVRSEPQEFAGFGDMKQGCMPEREMLSHKLSEYRMVGDQETGMIDCFSMRAH